MSKFEGEWDYPKGVVPIVGSLHALKLCKRKWLSEFFKKATEDPGLWRDLHNKYQLEYITVTATREDYGPYVIELNAVRENNTLLLTQYHTTGVYPRL